MSNVQKLVSRPCPALCIFEFQVRLPSDQQADLLHSAADYSTL